MKKDVSKKLEEKGLKIIDSFISVTQVFSYTNNNEVSRVKRFKFDKDTEKYFPSSEKKSSKELISSSACVRVEADIFYKVLIEDSVKKLFTCESDYEFDFFVVYYILNEIKKLKNIKVTNCHFDTTEYTHTFYNKDMSRIVVIERSSKEFVYNVYITKIINIKRYFWYSSFYFFSSVRVNA